MACVWRVSDQASFPMTPSWFRFADSASAGRSCELRLCLPPCGLKHNRGLWPACSQRSALALVWTLSEPADRPTHGHAWRLCKVKLACSATQLSIDAASAIHDNHPLPATYPLISLANFRLMMIGIGKDIFKMRCAHGRWVDINQLQSNYAYSYSKAKRGTTV